MKLTMKAIETLTCPPGKKDRLVFDEVQAGLAVRVTAKGGKSYLCQYTVNGVRRRVPLGSFEAISLAAAREAAAATMGEVAQSRDPAASRKEAAVAAKIKATRDTFTLGVLIQDWERLYLSGKRPRYAAEAVRAIRLGFENFLDIPATSIDRQMVVRALDTMTKARGPVMAARTVAYAKAAFQWSIKRGSLTSNPFMSLPVAPTEKRDRVLSDDELLAIWNAADPSTGYGAIVRFLILSGQRREEVAGMTWAEVSPDLTTWTIPADRAKNGVAHVVPLSEAAKELLRSCCRDGELVFPGRGGVFNGWSACKVRLDATSGVQGWRLHDLRRSVATGLQRLGVRLEVTEGVLNHVSGSRAGIVGVYQRHDWASEKRAALEAWGEHVAAIVAGVPATGNVVVMRKAK